MSFELIKELFQITAFCVYNAGTLSNPSIRSRWKTGLAFKYRSTPRRDSCYNRKIEMTLVNFQGRLKRPLFFVMPSRKVSNHVLHEIRVDFRDGNFFQHHPPRFVLVNVDDPRIKSACPISLMSRSTASEYSFEKIASWVDRCSTSHVSCGQLSQRTTEDKIWSPTRLLRIDSECAQSTTVLRLLECRENPVQRPYQYATLSYCWGTQSFTKLQRNNLSDFKQGIDLSLLPKTFTDATIAARKLGICYLWIDALCIIQDSPEDWAQEAVMMAKVYSYSTLTLAAAASKSSDGGLFYERDPLLCNGIKLSVNWHNDLLTASDRTVQGEYYCIRWDPWITSVCRSPLKQRAWVFQESLLSPRTVYFASDQLYWECGELYASEVYPTGGPWDLEFRERRFGTAKRIPVGLQPSDDGRFKHIYFAAFLEAIDGNCMQITQRLPYLWANIVSQYSSGELTFEDDKLIAISGVAKRLATILKDDKYIAGFWESNLALSLLWTSPHSYHKRISRYQAPSWSWASVSGRVEMDLMFRSHEPPNITIEILNVNVGLTNMRESTGSLTSGVLRVKGGLCKTYHSVIWKKDIRGPFSPFFYDRGQLGKTTNYSWLPYQKDACLLFKTRGLATWFPSKFKFDEEPKKYREIYCLEVATGRVTKSWGDTGFVAGLMLAPTAVKGQYSRIGYFELVPDGMRRSWRASVGMSLRRIAGSRKALESELFKSEDIDPKYYEVRDGDQYTISIV
ncbi:hypothetical protein HYFRA_00010149 [Hymenoscyphus fraxineus]|uniref:Heterokaryon incompatibility domain-containing protein n=1 Tax=Hymenoscyphus fraxineus TaxID=746836 RepID=A0A9N9KUM9_9HELO|nr:hypothetical protein HYFRA_00010149 [Hymenoscyphus fraxineus]